MDYSALYTCLSAVAVLVDGLLSESFITLDRMPMAPVDLACLGCLVKPLSSQPVLTMPGASVAADPVQTKLHPAAPYATDMHAARRTQRPFDQRQDTASSKK